MKLNKIKLFWKIWIFHIIIYYLAYLIIYRTLAKQFMFLDSIYDFLIFLFGAPLIMLLPVADAFSLFILIPITTMYLLLRQNVIKNIFKAYVVSLIIYFILNNILYMVYDDLTVPIYSGDIYQSILIFVSLFITVILNWLTFRKIYKRLKEEV